MCRTTLPGENHISTRIRRRAFYAEDIKIIPLNNDRHHVSSGGRRVTLILSDFIKVCYVQSKILFYIVVSPVSSRYSPHIFQITFQSRLKEVSHGHNKIVFFLPNEGTYNKFITSEMFHLSRWRSSSFFHSKLK